MGDGGVACVSSSSQHIMERFAPAPTYGTLRSTLQFPDRSPEKPDKKTEAEKKEERSRVLVPSRLSENEDRDRELSRHHSIASSSGDHRKRQSREESDYRSRRHYYEQEEASRTSLASSSKSRRVSEDSRSPGHSRSYRDSRSSKYSRHHDSDRNHDRHVRSPSHSDRRHDRDGRSPSHSDRHQDRHARSPSHSSRHRDRHARSPSRSERHYDRHARSPSRLDRHHDRYARSPSDSEKHRDRSFRSPSRSERSPRGSKLHHSDHREASRKIRRYSSPDRHNRRTHDERRSPSHGRDSYKSSSRPPTSTSAGVQNADKVPSDDQEQKLKEDSSTNCEEKAATQVVADETGNVVTEELVSMEEDMDICDSPPYVAQEHSGLNTTNSFVGNWFYLDHLGIERGPSRLCDLKKMVEDGLLVSDHLIKHSQSNRWMTVENAASPLVSLNLTSIVSDSVTQLVTPPEAPGNALNEAGELEPASDSRPEKQERAEVVENDSASSSGDLHIDDRVEELLKGHTVLPGREVETLAEALQITFDETEWETHYSSEGFIRPWDVYGDWSRHAREEGFCRGHETFRDSPHSHDLRSVAPVDKSLFAGRWSCHGGDWKRNDEAVHDRLSKRKVVLNDGFPLCQMPKSGYPDPRWHRPEFLALHLRRLEIPPWAYFWPEEKSDHAQQSDTLSEGHSSNPALSDSSVSSHGTSGTSNDYVKAVKNNIAEINRGIPANRMGQSKPVPAKISRGLAQPVVRNNAFMVKNHASVIKELRSKLNQASESLQSGQLHSQQSSACDGKSSSVEDTSHTKAQPRDSRGLVKCGADENAKKSCVLTADDLNLNMGEWYYLNGAGREQGPSSYSQLQALVANGTLPDNSSVYRKQDNIWVPVTSATSSSKVAGSSDLKLASGSTCGQVKQNQPDTHVLAGAQISGCISKTAQMESNVATASSFHYLYPQFVGYTRGRLQELVMKSFKSREFAAAINEVLDPWLNAKQPKKAAEKPFSTNFGSWVSSNGRNSLVSSNDFSAYGQSAKKPRVFIYGTEEDNDDENLSKEHREEFSFESMCSGADFGQQSSNGPDIGDESWGLLNNCILARIFHFLRADMKSLAFSAATCKHWSLAVKFYKDICRQVDLSQMGPHCTDSVFQNIMGGYNKEKLLSIVLTGCTNISAGALDEILQSFPSVSSIDIRRCKQFSDLPQKFHGVKRRKSYSHLVIDEINADEDANKIWNHKQVNAKSPLISRALRGLDGYLDDKRSTRDSLSLDGFSGRDSVRKLYPNKFKNSKSVGSRKFPSILPRNARMKGLFPGKSLPLSMRSYKKKEGLLAVGIKEIMRENTFEFFLPKVAEIEERMYNGYYDRRGLESVVDDISRMCRDAIKANTHNDDGDMTPIIRLFMKLVTSLQENSTSLHESEEISRTSKDGSASVYGTISSKNKKKDLKSTNDKRGLSKRSGSFSGNGVDFGDYMSDKECRRRLSRLNKKSLDSDSETTDESDLSVNSKGDGEDTAPETDEMDFHSDGEAGNSKDGYAVEYESVDSMAEDREWGARMTKASLVPPITRKYEVIDHYVVVADEEYVRRKMQVALPDDYAEKLAAQKEGVEELLEIPEVKDYRPRKTLADEVLEQEVYGIDPYTHNLLLDSIPEELEWTLQERCSFIEEVLLPALNKQVRYFTGTGNAPMEYNLKPVIEEIQNNAEEGGNKPSREICQALLKSVESRPDDNYVAYRKGLGVVCNKMEGFGEDDFVVEFLGEVYPAWKWFEKQDGIRFLQKNSQDPAPEFYNIYLERPKGDRDGYDLVVVDAMHKANYASRICHSCRPNCEAKVTAVDGQYQIGIYTVRPVAYGEEITFDYNSVTESKEEYEASVCLCGSQVCRGSYLNLTGEGAFQKVMKECHGILDRHRLMLEACELNSATKDDYDDLGKAGLGTCLLSGLPDWLITYSAHLVRYINFERTKLPEEILKHNLEEKRKFFSDICLEVEKNDADVQAEGVYNQRLQNLAVTLDKVRYVLRSVFDDPSKAPPPMQKVSPKDLVSLLWKGEGSLVEELLQCMAPHLDSDLLNELKSKIRARDPTSSDDVKRELRRSLLWLRDEMRNLPSSYKCRHDAAADLIHMYAYTSSFFTVREYKSVTSEPVYISPLDLGPKYADKLGSGFQEYRKTYGESYCLGQLIYWHNQTFSDPDSHLARARRGCLLLPHPSSFYVRNQKISRKHVYGQRTLRLMMSIMEKQPQRPWPKDQIWVFKSTQLLYGSPMLDAVINNSSLDREMMQWLRTRPTVSQASWDQ
ncbi:Histone-lysine N-methyltransferase [Nymphaea thermarum]|nr:Histone-lysine N-methyltransferase [Nymphaea thermarum]